MRILFVTPRFPFPPSKGDQLRVYHAIRHLGERHEIGLVCGVEDALTDARLAEMRRWCARVEVVPIPRRAAALRVARRAALSSLPLQVLYFDSAGMRAAVARALAATPYDVVHAHMLRVLPHVWTTRRPPVVVDLMDNFEISVAGRRDRAHPLVRPLYELERRRVAAYERRAVARFPEIVVAADGDRVAFGGGDHITTVGNGVDIESFRYGEPEGRDARTAIMTGNMGYGPNVDAALWFVREVWPRVRAVDRAARFRLVGAAPAPAVRLLDGRDGIEVTGAVPDVNAELRRATAAVCPMRAGTGVQNKVLEALASGTPLVSTTLGNRGVGAVDGRDLAIADDAEAMAHEVLALFGDAARRDAFARAGRALVTSAFGWEAHARDLEAIYARALSADREPAPLRP